MSDKYKYNALTGKLDITNKGNDGKYTSDVPTEEALGGIAAGETFDNVPIVDVIDRLLHKPLAPIVSLSANIKGGSFELGSVLYVNFTINVTRKTNDIAKVSLYNGSTATNQISDKVEKGGSFTIEREIKEAATYKATATDTAGMNGTSSAISYAFRNPIYYGLVDGIPDNVKELIKAIPSANKGELTTPYAAFDRKRFCFALYGSVSTVLNPSAFKIQDSLLHKTIQVKCADGVTRDYTLYYSEVNSQQADYPCKWNYNLK